MVAKDQLMYYVCLQIKYVMMINQTSCNFLQKSPFKVFVALVPMPLVFGLGSLDRPGGFKAEEPIPDEDAL
jgi:hypothetical protein